MTIKEAAVAMGVSEQFVRVGLQQQRLTFGEAVKMSRRWVYHINEAKFSKYMRGISESEKDS